MLGLGGLGIAVVAGLGGMLGWGFADFFAKKTIDQVGDIVALFWGQLFGLVPLSVLLSFHGGPSHLSGGDLVALALFGAGSAFSYLPLYAGLGKGEVSVLSPLFASYAAVVVLLSAVLFNEHISLKLWLALSAVMVGALLLSTNLSDLRRLAGTRTAARGVPEVLGAMLMYSVWLVLLDHFIGGRDWVFILLAIRTVSTACLFGYARARRLPLLPPVSGLWRYLIVIGVFDVAAFGSISWGFARGNHPSVVAVLSSCFSIPTIVLATVFLKERLTRAQAAAVLIVLGGIALVASQ